MKKESFLKRLSKLWYFLEKLKIKLEYFYIRSLYDL
jgi:hypothetical protein